ncbi:hypothetical protein D6D19_01616 [Aureobasidium pullulans]|uniref:Zinc finger PHD-type domain-containing protein n=1 Tax=Aureobasidium pullulans TaxID=5580 RepID=A0A4V4KS89_AURPU|nr:hypothetical protein D6D28_00504 [Aureobasidium pullulans]THW48226.1 hypothetical protein D6D22_02324 [Aureobasidium pullulans]THW67972.1 hypothetical protein D6D20_00197 [Aureobasidium pullulans]THW78912.1 hypothetical protein D6D19_01616 [Aureobasidium pullulans]THX08763.1 hypothetical protein D6D18_01524 [Aureobasidium pullulans]
MVSPRRSGRTTSTPADRNSRWHNKLSPRQKSPSPTNLSDDNLDAQPGALHSPDDSRQTRRATRAQHTHADDVDQESQTIEGDGDDEVTRCVCGLQDYPGPPSTDDFPTITDPSQAEDAGGLFIQCDKCHVWQHGGCVGIMDESKSPDNYFCELCDKKLHNVLTDSKGQRYSRYLPVMKPEPKTSRKSSLTKETESAKARREQRESQNRASVESSTGKRRSTMNSRQAYDDEETLRRIIEETKDVGESTPAVRKGKRGRDDSEDSKHEIKRQRTGSESPNPPSTLNTGSLDADSDDDGTHPKSNKKARSAAAELIRQREARERERTRDEKRKEAAGRRSERAGRRRADESDPLDDTPRPMGTPVLSTSQPPSPPASATPLAPESSHKKGTGKKQKRLGRNQYSAAKAPANTSDANAASTNPNGSSGDDPTTNSTTDSKNSPSSNNETPAVTLAPPAKPKPGKWGGRAKNPRQAAIQESEIVMKDNRENKSQMTITDMKKRTGMMMDYIAKAQVDMAGDRTPLNPQLQAQQPPDFKELSSREMMDVLTRHIMTWQKEYGGEAATAASLVA